MFGARLLPALASATAAVVLLSGCSAMDGLFSSSEGESSASSKPTASETPYPSQFTRDGTFQSHRKIDGMDFVYTLYPTKSTPRTNEWYPRGSKFFSFTFQVYDLDRGLRDPFTTKRLAYLDRITVDSNTVTYDGGRVEHPYRLDADAKRITFDPQPVSTKYGMLITSPKGAFELRNQRIKPTSLDTKGIDLIFTAVVWVEEAAGSDRFRKEVIRQKVPISIFRSDQPTEAQQIPINSN